MKNKSVFIVAILFAITCGLILGFYIRSQTLNPRAAIPFEHVLAFFVKEGELEDDDLLYYDTDLSDFILHGTKKTKVSVIGLVEKIIHQPDGDYHVILHDSSGAALVTEFIPEIKLSLPKEGDRIKIRGIVRFDDFHNWWELHPVIGWEKIK